MANSLRCGAAVGDITPLTEELEGLEALQRRPLGGILDPIHVRAVALESMGEKALWVCFELDKAPYPLAYIDEISEKYEIKKDNIFMLAAHVHSVPITGDRIWDGPNNIAGKPEKVKTITHRYEARIHEIVLGTIDEAIRTLRPARAGFKTGESRINVDRKEKYQWTDAGGTSHEAYALGMNLFSEINHTLSLLRFEDPDGAPIAFIANYPVHCTVMHANSCCSGKPGVSGDIAGYVSRMMEEKYPGAVCMWTSGAAGDINPLLQAEQNYPDPKTGEPRQSYLQGDTRALLQTMGSLHGRDLLWTASRISCTEEGSEDGLEGNQEIKAAAVISHTEGQHGDYSVRIHMMRLGSLYVVAVSGELYNSYTNLLKETLGTDRLIVLNHDCSNGYDSGYIPDTETFKMKELMLPGTGDHGNVVPENFTRSLIQCVTELYQGLQA